MGDTSLLFLPRNASYQFNRPVHWQVRGDDASDLEDGDGLLDNVAGKAAGATLDESDRFHPFTGIVGRILAAKRTGREQVNDTVRLGIELGDARVQQAEQGGKAVVSVGLWESRRRRGDEPGRPWREDLADLFESRVGPARLLRGAIIKLWFGCEVLPHEELGSVRGLLRVARVVRRGAAAADTVA